MHYPATFDEKSALFRETPPLRLAESKSLCIALAEEREARLVIIDERKARRYAQRLGLPITGTVGLLLLAKEKGCILSVAPLLNELQKNGLYLSSSLVTKALQLAGENSS